MRVECGYELQNWGSSEKVFRARSIRRRQSFSSCALGFGLRALFSTDHFSLRIDESTCRAPTSVAVGKAASQPAIHCVASAASSGPLRRMLGVCRVVCVSRHAQTCEATCFRLVRRSLGKRRRTPNGDARRRCTESTEKESGSMKRGLQRASRRATRRGASHEAQLAAEPQRNETPPRPTLAASPLHRTTASAVRGVVGRRSLSVDATNAFAELRSVR